MINTKLYKAAKFALEILEDQAKRFHQECRCRLCEVSIPMLKEAIEEAEQLNTKGFIEI